MVSVDINGRKYQPTVRTRHIVKIKDEYMPKKELDGGKNCLK